jgi:hypothetical protein
MMSSITIPAETLKPIERKEIKVDKDLTRSNPSAKYKELIKEYTTMHKVSDGMFNGRSLAKWTDLIHNYITKAECKTLLDYGSGKGHLYTDKFDTILDNNGVAVLDKPLPEIWNTLESYRLFDPGHQEYAELPEGKFDAVISTDVMEHIPESDLIWVIDEIFNYANKIIFLNIACFQALKTLANGSNAHVSVFHHMDWLELLAARSTHFKHLSIYIFFDLFNHDGKMDVKGFKISNDGEGVRVIELERKEE